MHDRFGPVPQQVKDLFDTVRCRWVAVELGFEKMMLKDETLRCYFVNKPDSPYFESETFRKLLEFIQTQTNQARLRQTGKMFMLIIENMKSMADILRFTRRIHRFVKEQPVEIK